ncbi:hypothetical protein K1719_016791 [Acacia pycnantha]|nr:hypothetical protein K1719_016791 [Acacia pycnantha]
MTFSYLELRCSPKFRAVCSKNLPCLIFLAETKAEAVNRLRCVNKLGFDGLSYVPSLGRSGGILAAWNSSFIEVDVINLDRQSIHLRCRFPNEGWFFVTALYAIPDTRHKQILWSTLNGFASSMVLPWVVVGDFNDIASLSERTGGLGSSEARCSLFSDRIQSCNLMDLGAVGPKFTWRGPKLSGGRRLFERLDRAIANGEFLSSFTDCSVQMSESRYSLDYNSDLHEPSHQQQLSITCVKKSFPQDSDRSPRLTYSRKTKRARVNSWGFC